MEKNSCHLYAGTVNKDGYGVVFDKEYGNYKLAHRLSFVADYGEIPQNSPLDHVCRQPRCINPEHLEPVTMRENILRGVGIAANYANRNRCKNGHLFTVDNIYKWAKRENARLCKKCRKLQNIKYRNKLKKVEV